MANPEFVLTTTQTQEDAASKSMGMHAGDVADYFRIVVGEDCIKGVDCGLHLAMDEHPNDSTVQQTLGDMLDRPLDGLVTDVTVTCRVESCPHPEKIQELGETLLRAFGQAPLLD